MAMSTLKLEVDDGLRDSFTAVAEGLGLTAEQLLQGLVQDCVSTYSPGLDRWIRDEVQAGIDEGNPGLVTPAEEVEAEFLARRMARNEAAPGA